MKDGSTASLEAPASNAWRTATGLWLALVLTLLWVYREGYASLVELWSKSETYTHGFVVPLISLWLAWRVRGRLKGLVPSPSGLALLGMLLVALVWLLGDLVAVNALVHPALVALVVLSFVAVFGTSIARQLMFPLGFLFFAVPMGDFMLPWLMDRTADFTVLALRLTGIPVYREGLQFVIPSGTWSVVEACSGIRYLIASLMVGCLFAYLSYSSLRKRWLFMLVALLVPLLANWMRAYIIVMIGHLSGNELATGVDHLIYGWVFFGAVILAMLFIGARWADPVDADQTDAAVVVGKTPVKTSVRALSWTAAFSAAVLVAPQVLLQGLQSSINPASPVLARVAAAEPWQPTTSHASDWVPAFQNPSDESRHSFAAAAGPTVDLGISYYRQQGRDRKLVSSSNALVRSDDERWAQVQRGVHSVVMDGQPLVVQTAVLRDRSSSLTSNAVRLRVWRFYWVDNRFIVSDVQAKLLGALQLLQGEGDDAAILVLSTPLDDRLPEVQRVSAADELLTGFLQAQSAPLQSALLTTQQGR